MLKDLPRGWVRAAYRWVATRSMTDRDRLAQHWIHELDGDHTYRLDYPLARNSVVVDVGGYKGQYASDVFGRFCCQVHVYEPVASFAQGISHRFEHNPSVYVHAYGLAGADRTERLDVRGDQTSALSPAADGGELITLKGAVAELQALGDIDLLKLNIEGLEYNVLDSLLAAGLQSSIRFLQIQFHDFAPDAVNRRERIRAELRLTHELAWDFPFVWESWSRRS
ncbi:MAG: FkbM family methyltransferase [Frankiaceae bacterium]|nr:FkbM family methyltransferase [Frankiaceae bacterium]